MPNKRLLGAGLVMAGPFGRVGLSDAGQSTLRGWSGVDPQALFSKALGLPVTIEHDAIAAALAEQVGGAAAALGNYCFVYFGTGIGLGVVSAGQAIRGAFGNAGELGHVIVVPDGNLCACGNRGCLETYVSRFAVHQHMANAKVDIRSGDDLQRLHEAGNPHLLDWLNQCVAPLSQAIGMLENLFDPEAIILGGAMPDPLLQHLIDHLELPSGSVSIRSSRRVPRVVRGKSGRMSATLGGAALTINNNFTP